MPQRVRNQTRHTAAENGAGETAEVFPRPIRVTIVQPSLAKYRIPVFRELASRPGIDLRVVYGSLQGLRNVEADGFAAAPCRLRQLPLGSGAVMFQSAHWTNASPRQSEVLVMQWSPRIVSVALALLRARLSGVATVLWGHGYSKAERWWWTKVRNLMGRLATALVFYEPRTRDAFLQRGWDPRKLFVALNSIDNAEIDRAREWWQSRPAELARFRHENELDQGPVILFVSRLQPANGVDLLIQATAELIKEIPGLKTVIIGDGAAERERLQLLAGELDVVDSVVFQDGIYDELKLAPWFLTAGVFCYPANVGLSLIHALWYGVPTITTDNLAVQNPEIVALEPGVNGLLYEHENTASLVTALRRVLTDQGLRESLSRAARRTADDRFTVANMVDGLEAAVRYAYEARSVPAPRRQTADPPAVPDCGRSGG